METHNLLTEESKRTHIEHIEDIIFDQGSQGVMASVMYIKSLYDMLKGSSESKYSVSMKWDGAPAIVCGTDPETDLFFVGTKSVFNKDNPKIMYTIKDIEDNYSEQPDLANKLSACLEHLRKLNIQGVVQGDFMFDEQSKQKKTIQGEEHIVFKPNEIVYAVPINSDIGRSIETAKVGIVFHTSYTGDTIKDMTASPGVDINAFTQTTDVWFDNATFDNLAGTATMTKQESTALASLVKQAAMLAKINKGFLDKLQAENRITQTIKMYINSMIRAGTIESNPQRFIQGLTDFYADRMETQKLGLKTEKGRIKRDQELANFKSIVQKNMNNFQKLIQLFGVLGQAKMLILRKLNTLSQIGSFRETETGFEVTAPEGFVAADTDGNVVKLVDRLEFSKANLNAVSKFQGLSQNL